MADSQQRFTETADGEVRARLSLGENILISVVATLVAAYMWIVRLTCRFTVISGAANVEQAMQPKAVLPCGWHQGLLLSGLFLAGLKGRGLRAGFLISPSREGEFITRVARLHATAVVRGSSTRTGSQAIRALTRSLETGISPMIFADGPRGPVRTFKPGAVVVSARGGHALWLVGCAANRAWHLKTWDATIIPKPFTRIAIAVSPLIHPPRPAGDGQIAVEEQCQMLAQQLNELTARAENHLAAGVSN